MAERRQYVYSCDLEGCGWEKVYSSQQHLPRVHVTLEPGGEAHYTFCSQTHLDLWLQQHGLEGLK